MGHTLRHNDDRRLAEFIGLHVLSEAILHVRPEVVDSCCIEPDKELYLRVAVNTRLVLAIPLAETIVVLESQAKVEPFQVVLPVEPGDFCCLPTGVVGFVVLL